MNLASITHNTQQKVGDTADEQIGCSKITFLTLTITITLQRNHVIRICWSVSCHCRTTSTFHARKLSVISSNVFIFACNSNFSRKWNI